MINVFFFPPEVIPNTLGRRWRYTKVRMIRRLKVTQQMKCGALFVADTGQLEIWICSGAENAGLEAVVFLWIYSFYWDQALGVRASLGPSLVFDRPTTRPEGSTATPGVPGVAPSAFPPGAHLMSLFPFPFYSNVLSCSPAKRLLTIVKFLWVHENRFQELKEIFLKYIWTQD